MRSKKMNKQLLRYVLTACSIFVLAIPGLVSAADIEVFSDHFSAPDYSDVGNAWTASGGSIYRNSLKLYSTSSYPSATHGIDSSGVTNLRLLFQYRGWEVEAGDQLEVYSSLDNTSFTRLASYDLTNSSSVLTPAPELALPDGTVAIRFSVPSTGDEAYVDEVRVLGDAGDCVLFVDRFTRRDYHWLLNGWSTSMGVSLKDWHVRLDPEPSQTFTADVNRGITVPAGYTSIKLSFRWRGVAGESQSGELLFLGHQEASGWYNVLEIFDLYAGRNAWQTAEIYLPSDFRRIMFMVQPGTVALVDDVVVVAESGCGGDTAPPVVTNVAATPDPQTFDGDVLISADVTDDTGIASVEYTLDGGSNWTAMTLGAGSTYTATLDAPFVGDYSVCVRATDTADPANTSEPSCDNVEGDCEGFEVQPAQATITFGGQELDLDGAPTQLKAEVTGPCSSGAEVSFFMGIGDDQWQTLGKADTNISGEVTLSGALPVGVHDIKVEVGDQDLDGDSAPECLGAFDTGITVVADPKASSTGGGWYKIDGLSPPRVNFGYTAQRKYNKKLDEYSTSGNLLWMHQDSYRLKGVIDSGGMLPAEMCDSEFAACAAFAGKGTLYDHNPAYDPTYPPTDYRGVEWINPSPNTPFVIFVNDGGTSRECVGKKKCKEVEKPDQFGIQIELESVPAESDPVYLNGGNLVVK
jgi:hypothetical protein